VPHSSQELQVLSWATKPTDKYGQSNATPAVTFLDAGHHHPSAKLYHLIRETYDVNNLLKVIM